MTDHGKVEHRLPNGDLLVWDTTERRPEVDRAFEKVEAALKESAAVAFRSIKQSEET